MRGGANGHEAHRTSRGVLCCVLACDAKRAEAQPKPPDSGGGGAPPAPPHTRLTCTCDVAWGVLTLYRGNSQHDILHKTLTLSQRVSPPGVLSIPKRLRSRSVSQGELPLVFS